MDAQWGCSAHRHYPPTHLNASSIARPSVFRHGSGSSVRRNVGTSSAAASCVVRAPYAPGEVRSRGQQKGSHGGALQQHTVLLCSAIPRWHIRSC
jgi:hypothetical protein